MWLNFTCYNHKVEHNFYISKLSTTCNDEDSLLFPQNEYKAREGLVVVGNVGRWIICCLPRVQLPPNPAVSLCWRWAEVNMQPPPLTRLPTWFAAQPHIVEASPPAHRCSQVASAAICTAEEKEWNILGAQNPSLQAHLKTFERVLASLNFHTIALLSICCSSGIFVAKYSLNV